jgi:hypothetical protein
MVSRKLGTDTFQSQKCAYFSFEKMLKDDCAVRLLLPERYIVSLRKSVQEAHKKGCKIEDISFTNKFQAIPHSTLPPK